MPEGSTDAAVTIFAPTMKEPQRPMVGSNFPTKEACRTAPGSQSSSCVVLLTMAAIDIDVRRLPDRFTKPLVPASVLGTGLVALVTGSGGDWVRGVLGGLVLGVVYLVLALLGRGTGLGLGDVKLAPSLGVLLAFHSWAAVVLASVLAFVSAGVFGLVLIGLRRADRRSTLAFGPHMIGSAVLVLAAPGLGWVLGLSSTG